MSEWKETNLYEIIDLIGGGTPKTSVPDYWNGNIPWLSVADFNNGKKYVFETEKTITEKGLTNSSTKFLNKGDIIISARGTVGVVAVLGREMTFNQSCYGIKAKQDLTTNEYVYYLLKDTVSGFLQIAHGGVFDTITRDTFKEIEITLPPLPEQTAIASVLSSLDDKIDLLHRQNATLEKMAETMFRQWFVEEAKEEWGMGNLGDLFTLQRGFDLPIQNRVKGSYPIYASSGESGFHIESKVTGPGVTTGRSGVLGNVFYIQEDFWPLNTSLYIKEFKNSSPLHSYFVLKTIDLNSFNAGSAVPTLNRNHVHEFPIEIPPMSLVNQFDNIASPLFIKIKSNQTQIRNLTDMRDNLLPKLMSGEARVGIK